MKAFIITLLITVLVVGLMATSCRPQPPEVPPYPDEMPCGMVVDLSGPNAEMGNRLSKAAEVAVTQMNDWGGIRNMLSMNLRLIVADDGGSPVRAAAEAERLITEEEVIYLIGTWPTAAAISEVAEEHGTPFIGILNLDTITELGREYTFRTTPSANATVDQIVSAMTQSAEEAGLPLARSCFLMYVPDDQGTTVAEVFRVQAEAAGIEIVGEEIIDTSAISFTSQLASIEAAGPDLLFTCNYTDDAIILYQEMMERQIHLPYGVYSWGWGLEDPAFYEALPPEAYEYSFVHESADPVAQKRDYYYWINDAIQAKIGEDWDNPAIAAGYHTIWLVKEAMELMTPVRRVSRPGVHEGMEFSLDLDKFRSNLQYSIANFEITGADVEKVQLPDGSPFLPSLEVLRFTKVQFDEKGQMAPLDQIFSAYAVHMLNKEKGPIVTHVEASMCVEKMVEAEGGKVIRTKVGDVSIAEAMKKHKAVFGGEPCGAWVHPAFHYCPDGILSSILLLKAVEEADQSLSQFTSKAPIYPLLRRNISCPHNLKHEVLDQASRDLQENFQEINEISWVDGMRLTFPDGWLLLRPSGTEPYLRLTVEAQTKEVATDIMNTTVNIVNTNIERVKK